MYARVHAGLWQAELTLILHGYNEVLMSFHFIF